MAGLYVVAVAVMLIGQTTLSVFAIYLHDSYPFYMKVSFPDNYEKIANDMGIALYQRFSLVEASLFLRCPEKDVERLVNKYKLNYIRVTKTEIQFFGFQLLEYLLSKATNNTVQNETPVNPKINHPERIVRTKELLELIGLSRTTIWRMEKEGKFPKSVSLGEGSIGWRWSEVTQWLKECE